MIRMLFTAGVCASLLAVADAPKSAQSPGGVAPSATTAPAEPIAARATIADVAWMSGRWRDESKDGYTDECWGPPLDRTMVGYSRIGASSDRAVYEILLIEQTGETLTLWLRHFTGPLKSREVDAMRFVATRIAPNEITFDGTGGESSTRLTYRLGDAGELICVLEKAREGKTRRFEFKLARVKD